MGRLRTFLTAEEVPRWFGLTVVLIYLTGLAMIANMGIGHARRLHAGDARAASAHGLELLAFRIASIDVEQRGAAASKAIVHRQLLAFADAHDAEVVRIVQAGAIVTSTQPGEIGKALADEPEEDAAARADHRWRSEAVIPRLGGLAGSAGETVPARLCATFSIPSTASRGFLSHAGTLSIVLVLLGALFVCHRCLREQMRSASRVADRLTGHAAAIERDLDSLRIGDAAGVDGVTESWNDLVELVGELQDAVRKQHADEELSSALLLAGSGALGAAIDSLPDAMLHLGESGVVEYANAAAGRLLGCSVESLREHGLEAAAESELGRRIAQIVSECESAGGEFVSRSETIETIERGGESGEVGEAINVTLSPVRGSKRASGCVLVMRDVSQQRRSESARDEFITQVTHELRTPLTNIRAYAETLSSGMFDDPTTITECYNVIMKETRRLSRLIEDILNISQLEVGSIELHRDDVALRTLLEEAVRDVKNLADEKSIEIAVVLPPKLETIQGDRDKLAVVVNNLLGNAIKYTPAGGNVVLGCQLSGSEVAITVKDNGIGIAPEDQRRVFEKFQRAADDDVQRETGTGIGLYTAREIVRRHGGDIDLISAKGQGSTFLVRLPHEPGRAERLNSITQSERGA